MITNLKNPSHSEMSFIGPLMTLLSISSTYQFAMKLAVDVYELQRMNPFNNPMIFPLRQHQDKLAPM